MGTAGCAASAAAQQARVAARTLRTEVRGIIARYGEE